MGKIGDLYCMLFSRTCERRCINIFEQTVRGFGDVDYGPDIDSNFYMK